MGKTYLSDDLHVLEVGEDYGEDGGEDGDKVDLGPGGWMGVWWWGCSPCSWCPAGSSSCWDRPAAGWSICTNRKERLVFGTPLLSCEEHSRDVIDGIKEDDEVPFEPFVLHFLSKINVFSEFVVKYLPARTAPQQGTFLKTQKKEDIELHGTCN